MKIINKKIITIISALLVSIPITKLSAETKSLPELLVLAAENNDEIGSALRNYKKALKASESIYDFDSIQLGVNGNYQIASEENPGYSANLSIPVISRISLSGSVNQNGSGSVGLSLKPFSTDLSQLNEDETLKKASWQYQNLLFSSESNITRLLISYSNALNTLQIAEKNNELTAKNYLIAQKQYEMEDVSYEGLLNSQKSAAEAAQNYTRENINLLNAEQALKQQIGPVVPDYTPIPLSEEDLQNIIESLDKEIKKTEIAEPASQTLLNYQAELESLEKEQKKTLIYQPDLSVSTTLDYPKNNINIGVSLNFSLADIKTDEKEELDYQIKTKQNQINNEIYKQELSLSNAQRNIEISKSGYQIARDDYELSQIQVKEAQFLYESGDRTSGEVLQAEINLLNSQKNVFSSLSGIISGQFDYLSYFFKQF